MSQFIGVDEPVGYLHIGDGYTISYYKKLPNKFHRFMQWLFLGFRWEENKKYKGDDEAKRKMCERAVQGGVCPHTCDICAWNTLD